MGRGGRRGSSPTSVAEGLLPSEEESYYGDLEKKHFSDEAVGSRFVGDTLPSLLERNPQLLGKEDHRQKFLDLGVSPDALLPDRSYFLLRAQGEEGMVAADALSETTPVEIQRAKAGSLSLAVRGAKRPRTSLATAIVGDYPRDPSRRALITIFPGLPSDPARSSLPEDNSFGLRDGDTVPLGELQKRLGRDDLLLQIIDEK